MQLGQTSGTATRRTSGIVSSTQPRGWLANRWIAHLAGDDKKLATRIARGKTFARNGRVQDLWFSPGLATAEVADGPIYRVSVRIRVFEEPEWDAVLTCLASSLTRVASMIEGELEPGLVSDLERAGVSLLPRPADVDGDCDCANYILPCVHMAAVHQLLAEALDGDPFLLFTLRGWDRDRLASRLRALWGDTGGSDSRHTSSVRPPGGDWLRSPASLPHMAFDVRHAESAPMGVVALGPAPDQADLSRALEPLYDAASMAAHTLFCSDEPLESNRPIVGTPIQRHSTPVKSIYPEAPVPESTSLTERLIDALAEVECAKSNDLAKRLGETTTAIRTELLELEEMGLVTRTGKTRGTRWWIG